MKTLYGILIIFLISQSSLYSSSKFLLKTGIVDIGHKEESSEIEVPKERIISEPNMSTSENKLTYQKRIQSEKFDCETDFLGTETCTQQQTVCPSYGEYEDGYSVASIGSKIIYTSKTTTTSTASSYYGSWSTANRFWRERKSAKGWNTFDLPNSSNLVGGVTIPLSRNAGSLSATKVWSSYYGGYIDFTVSFSSRSGGRGSDMYFSTSIRRYYPAITTTIVSCPSGYSEAEGTGSNACKKTITYTYYNYLCSTETNELGQSFSPIDGGGTTTTSAIPPSNNCVRLNYTCPLDSSQKCGETINTTGICEDGYIWNSNRCERVESYCGNSFYNVSLDVCQDVTNYEKLCINSNEIYNNITNNCETNTKACSNGVFNEDTNKCVSDFEVICQTNGYIYNNMSGVCEDPDSPICETQYNYNGSLCKGEMTMCATGFFYNKELNKCEKDICKILNTSDIGARCETPIQCEGVVNNGRCIPNTLQE
ncbi:hypothetical protein [Sulfurimonas sp.]|uniref:hypothetical protein n=1 Tax=Sulfurimonas sp. TaxID=2022749 RepID=UPI0025F75BAA|nr:hypothetical protein [Sulfurimonas sp.]